MRVCSVLALLLLVSPSCLKDLDPPDADATAAADTAADVASACAPIGALYRVSGACSSEAPPIPLALEPIVCIWQEGCAAFMTLTAELSSVIGIGHDHWTADPRVWPGGCQGDIDSDTITFACVDDTSRTECVGSATRIPIASATRFCCDATRQDCATDERCAVIHSEGVARVATACVPRGGERAVGSACTVPDGVGPDACSAGAGCSALGSPDGASTCQRLCHTRSDCALGETCATTVGETVANEDLGVCRPICDLMAPHCPTGTSCTLRFEPRPLQVGSAVTTICDRPGAVGDGAPCMQLEDCAAGLVCAGDDPSHEAICTRPCDEDHPCAAGRACATGYQQRGAELARVRFCLPE